MLQARSFLTLFSAFAALSFTPAFVEAAKPPPLNVLKLGTSPNGFSAPPRGWNSFSIQSNPKTVDDWTFDQDHVVRQCAALTTKLGSAKYTYCSLDSGWSVGDRGDQHGRIIPDKNLFPDFEGMADWLHSQGLKLGVYLLPGAFCADGHKKIEGTDIKLNETFSGNDDGFLRCDFDFDKPGVQEWHNSVVNLLAKMGVDFIKLDFVTPGSPDNHGHLPENNSGAVIAYHNAIKQAPQPLRLDISWKLERNDTYYAIWENNADSMRIDQDLNNVNSDTMVPWRTVQRTINQYRNYSGTLAGRSQTDLTIFPDMDNTFVGNAAKTSGLSDTQRYTQMTHWIGAGANLITGSDLTSLDALGLTLLTDEDALAVADFTANYPMQPRNPGTGFSEAKQLQAWIAGPNDQGDQAVVVLANYGPDEGEGRFKSYLKGERQVNVTFEELGLEGSWNVKDVWAKEDWDVQDSSLTKVLKEGESVLLKLTKAAEGPSDGNGDSGSAAGDKADGQAGGSKDGGDGGDDTGLDARDDEVEYEEIDCEESWRRSWTKADDEV